MQPIQVEQPMVVYQKLVAEQLKQLKVASMDYSTPAAGFDSVVATLYLVTPGGRIPKLIKYAISVHKKINQR